MKSLSGKRVHLLSTLPIVCPKSISNWIASPSWSNCIQQVVSSSLVILLAVSTLLFALPTSCLIRDESLIQDLLGDSRSRLDWQTIQQTTNNWLNKADVLYSMRFVKVNTWTEIRTSNCWDLRVQRGYVVLVIDSSSMMLLNKGTNAISRNTPMPSTGRQTHGRINFGAHSTHSHVGLSLQTHPLHCPPVHISHTLDPMK